MVANHLSKLALDQPDKSMDINEIFPDEQLFSVKTAPWYAKRCDRCQRTGNVSRKIEMPLKSILKVELFDV